MSIGQSRPPDEAPEPSQPDEPAHQMQWEQRLSTSKLFGLYLVAARTSERVTVEGLANSCDRTQSWIRSVERGEIILTREMVGDLDVGLSEAQDPPGRTDYDLEGVFIELANDPWGELGDRLRETFGVDRFSEDAVAAEVFSSDALLPVTAGFTAADRLLVVFPAALLAFLSIGLFFTWTWARRWSPAPKVDLQLVLFLGVGAVSMGALVFPLLGAGLYWSSRVVRTPLAATKAASARAWRNEYGLPSSGATTWYHPGIADHLEPQYRSAALGRGLGAEFAERLALVFAVVTPLAILLAWLLGLRPAMPDLSLDPDTHPRSAILLVVAAASFALGIVSVLSARLHAGYAHSALVYGLGLRVDEDYSESTAMDKP